MGNKIVISRKIVEGLPASDREVVFWDRELSGFGIRMYPSGSKVYIVQTRANGRSMRITIGRHGMVSADQARREAAQLISTAKAGGNPVPSIRSNAKAPRSAAAPSLAEVAERYMSEHVEVRCRSATVAKYRNLLDRYILPELGNLCFESIGRERIAALQYKLHEIPTTANRTVTLLSQIHKAAEGWGIASEYGNPCRFIRKYPERNRERFLSEEEFHRLGKALSEMEAEGRICPRAVAAYHLLMLTGCRRNEILTLRWEDVDLEAGELRLRNAKSGPRQVALSPSAVSILEKLYLASDRANPWVIASRRRNKHLAGLNRGWLIVRERAGLPDVRIHDLRHSFASRALAMGESLPMIGSLLGHRELQTTARYAHLAQDSVKISAARVAESLRVDLSGRGNKDNLEDDFHILHVD